MKQAPWTTKPTPLLKTKKPKVDDYVGTKDAEDVLERVLKRARYNSATLEGLTTALERIVVRELNKRL